MHEAFRRRLEALEAARRLQDGPVKMISIGFVEGDGSLLGFANVLFDFGRRVRAIQKLHSCPQTI